MQNCRIIIDSETNKGSVIDPGGDVSLIMEAIKELNVEIESVIVTHPHLDHAGGTVDLLSELANADYKNVTFLCHAGGLEMGENISQQAAMFGAAAKDFKNLPKPDRLVEEGEVVSIGEVDLKVIYTPGHCPGHISLFIDEIEHEHIEGASGPRVAPLLIAGDTVFSGSIGRTDLPGGDHRLLIQIIKDKILTLPSKTVIMSGHGPDTAVGIEKESNPFLI